MTRLEFDKAWFFKDKLVKERFNTPKGEREELGVIKEVNFSAYMVRVLIKRLDRHCLVGCENIRFV